MAGTSPAMTMELAAVIARSASDEAIHPSAMPSDGLLRCARNDVEVPVVTRRHLLDVPAVPAFARRNFFIIFVDGIFTTFIERPFTNTSHAIGKAPAIACV